MPTSAQIKAKPHQDAHAGGRVVARSLRALSPAEQLADMEAHGREVRKSKTSALAFLRRAGIVNDKGELAEPYRA